MRFGRMTMVLMAGALAACGGDEEDPTGGGHDTVADAALYVDDVLVEEVLTLPAGALTRVEVRFLNDHGEVIDEGLRPAHVSSLTFTPGSLGTVADVSTDSEFLFDVTTSPIGDTGSVSVGYGHGTPNEMSFGPFPVQVVN